MPTMRCESLRNGKWVETYRTEDELAVYRTLAGELVAKKLDQCTWIKSIRRVQKYTHLEITVTEEVGYRRIYELPAHM
jgi:hypothetical protein